MNLKKVFSCIIVISIVLAISGCSNPNTDKPESTDIAGNIIQGNTNGNLYAGGYAAFSNGWIYYSAYEELYKSNGSEKIKLCEDRCKDINIIGDLVFYINSGSGEIYKINTDGTGKEQIGKEHATSLQVVRDWIYYVSSRPPYNLYKMKTDGSCYERVADIYAIEFDIKDGWIYFCSEASSDDYNTIYKMKVDGTEITKVFKAKDGGIAFINISGDYIYYLDKHDIHRIKIDGTEDTKMNRKYPASRFFVLDDCVYYMPSASDAPSLMKISSDGTQEQSFA